MTIDANSLMSTLSNSMTEPWWENYWVVKSQFINFDQHQYLSAEIKFYFISVSTLQKKRAN